MIFSENRFPLFGIMLQLADESDFSQEFYGFHKVAVHVCIAPVPSGTRASARVQVMVTLRMAVLQCALILAASGASAAGAGLENENLLMALPPGYKIGFNEKKPDMLITEFVPDKETVENWTEMVTMQIFYRLKTTPHQFMKTMDKGWRAACPDTQDPHIIADVPENGYPTRVWLSYCPKNPQSGKPEITWFKAVQGNDSFYLVKKAFKFQPDKEQITRWMNYLRDVSVCDSRIADRACSKTPD
jgi:hypothetical protein